MRAPCFLSALLVAAASAALAAAQGDQPRAPLPKMSVALPAAADLLPGVVVQEPQLIVKFADDARVRATSDGGLVSLAGHDLAGVQALRASLGLRFAPCITLPEADLSVLEQRAAARSGRMQPDLAGLLRGTLRGDPAALLAASDALLRLPQVEFVSLQELGAPPPGDIAPPTPDLVPLQTYHGAEPGMNSDAANAAGFDGAGRRLSDCEYGWIAMHEDLDDIDLHLAPGWTVHPNVAAYGWDQHGTAVLGVTSCSVNGYGCSGMASGATVYTFPEWTVEGGFSVLNCVAHAIADTRDGDVVLLEMQTVSGAPVETDPAVWLLVKAGTDAGVAVVAAAGNGNQDLDGPAFAAWRALGDSGAIIVGAGSASVAHDKLRFSSFGARVDVQGWGESVASLGFGDYAEYGGDKNQDYTDKFSGTSSASACAAAACLIVQQIATVQRGEPLSPLALRQLLVETGVPQGQGGHIGPLPDCERAMDALLPWKGLGSGLAGAGGVPALDGTGTLQPGSPYTLVLHGAPPLAPATLVLGLSTINAPCKGGTLVPAPEALVVDLVTSAEGIQAIGGRTPAGLPPGLVFYLQEWIADAGAVSGFAASNALSGTVPP